MTTISRITSRIPTSVQIHIMPIIPCIPGMAHLTSQDLGEPRAVPKYGDVDDASEYIATLVRRYIAPFPGVGTLRALAGLPRVH